MRVAFHTYIGPNVTVATVRDMTWHVRVGSNHRPRLSESRALASELRTYGKSTVRPDGTSAATCSVGACTGASWPIRTADLPVRSRLLCSAELTRHGFDGGLLAKPAVPACLLDLCGSIRACKRPGSFRNPGLSHQHAMGCATRSLLPDSLSPRPDAACTLPPGQGCPGRRRAGRV